MSTTINCSNLMCSMKKIIFIISLFCLHNCFAFNYKIKPLRLNNRILKTNILELNCEKNDDGKCVCQKLLYV